MQHCGNERRLEGLVMARCTLCAALMDGTVLTTALSPAESSIGSQRDSVCWKDVGLAAQRCLALLRTVACASPPALVGWKAMLKSKYRVRAWSGRSAVFKA